MTEHSTVLTFNSSDFFVSRTSPRSVTLIFREIAEKDSYLDSVFRTHFKNTIIKIYSEKTGVVKKFPYYTSRNYEHNVDHDDAMDVKTNGRVPKKVLVFYDSGTEDVIIRFYVAEEA